MRFIDLSVILTRIGQVGVVIIAAGILDGVFGQGSVGEVSAVNAFGAGLILLSSVKIRSRK